MDADDHGQLDADVLARCAGGSKNEALSELYRRHAEVVFRVSMRLCGTRELAEDITQEVFAKLAQSPPEERMPLRPWLLRVARNLFVDYRRRAVLDIDRMRDLALWPQSQSPSPEARVEGATRLGKVERALLRMPLALREAIVLVCVEGFSGAEAAEVLGITPESLRQRVARGRALLRRELGGRR